MATLRLCLRLRFGLMLMATLMLCLMPMLSSYACGYAKAMLMLTLTLMDFSYGYTNAMPNAYAIAMPNNMLRLWLC